MGTHINIIYIIQIIISWIINSYFIYEYTPGLAEEMEQQELKKYSFKDDIWLPVHCVTLSPQTEGQCK